VLENTEAFGNIETLGKKRTLGRSKAPPEKKPDMLGNKVS
jgi:hypothetical protein